MRSLNFAIAGSYLQDNLACGYLAAVAEQAGHKPRFIPLSSTDQVAKAAGQVLEISAELVGISIPFQNALAPALQFAEYLRTCGYKGHITCGGHVPTFCAEEIL